MRNTLVFLPLCVLVIVGCDARIEHFEPNEVHALTLASSRGVETEMASRDASEMVEALFGTPNEPKWPAEILNDESARSLININLIKRSAGPVYSDREGNNFGLFNKHCVICHGVSGSGAGPASVFQNPYPRDFRAGIFKWKSTTRSSKPTRDDLARTLHDGVAGTGMPSFAVLSEVDWVALIDYVIYLSIRGQSERALQALAIDDLGYDGNETDGVDLLRDSNDQVAETINDIVSTWTAATDNVVSVPAETTNDVDSVARGKEIFHGQIANCVGCHGPNGNGEAVTLDFDDWSKEYSSRLGLTPTDREAMKPFRKAGAHRPRQIRPRKLDEGVFRGGADSMTLYRRISQGIAGTPMPSIEISASESTTGLSTDQAWDLVHYIQSLAPKKLQAATDSTTKATR